MLASPAQATLKNELLVALKEEQAKTVVKKVRACMSLGPQAPFATSRLLAVWGEPGGK